MNSLKTFVFFEKNKIDIVNFVKASGSAYGAKQFRNKEVLDVKKVKKLSTLT